MSAGGAFGGNRGLRPVPPEKGIFPVSNRLVTNLKNVDFSPKSTWNVVWKLDG
ncbi:hypothetical protein OIU78_010588 [Salix suchowensis]|nr:hypothetical protein OIU78_010588 [Salix suchowensis]